MKAVKYSHFIQLNFLLPASFPYPSEFMMLYMLLNIHTLNWPWIFFMTDLMNQIEFIALLFFPPSFWMNVDRRNRR